MNSAIAIRPAEPKDAALILKFITDLAIYERAEHEVVASEDAIRDSLFSEHSTTHALICTIEGVAVGFAVYFYNYSTWLGKRGIYLEDLYISPEHRGKRAGRALLQYLAQIAVSQNCGRFEWNVLDWNTPAIQFYKSIGAVPLNEWIGYRLAGDALKKFAEDKPNGKTSTGIDKEKY